MRARGCRAVAALALLAALLSGCASIVDPLERQIVESDARDVTSVQGYLIGDEVGARELVERWEALAERMRERPGFVRARLGRGTAGSRLWLASSEWRDARALRDAFSDAKVLALEAAMPDRLFGHLYERVASRSASAR